MYWAKQFASWIYTAAEEQFVDSNFVTLLQWGVQERVNYGGYKAALRLLYGDDKQQKFFCAIPVTVALPL